MTGPAPAAGPSWHPRVAVGESLIETVRHLDGVVAVRERLTYPE